MKIDNDTMTGAGRLMKISGLGLIPFFLLGVSCVASLPETASAEKAPLPEVRMKPTKLALFKNGYGTVTLEGKTAKGSAMELTGLPTPSYGSFWLSAEPGVSVRELVSSRVNDKIPKTDYGRSEFLKANAGKLVRVTTDKGMVIEGRVAASGSSLLLDARRPNMMDAASSPVVEEGSVGYGFPSSMDKGILLQTETGYVMFQENSLRQIEMLDKDVSFPFWIVERTRLVLNLENPAPGKTVTVSSLSSGISWLPSYRVELGEGGKGHLQCKAIIMNELMDLDKVDMELISGFPSLQMPGLPSPISMKQTMSDLFASLGSDKPGTEYARSRLTSNIMSQSRTWQPVFNMEAPTAIDPNKIRQAEDLFFYSISGFSCKYRERVTRTLFDGNIPYSHVYTWDIPDQKTLAEWNRNRSGGEKAPSPLEVWHCIRLTNSLNAPWSTGIVELVSQGRLAGQSTLTFTNPGEQVLVRLNKSMETMVHVSEETISSEQVKHKNYTRQQYTVKGSLTMKNISGREMDVQVRKSIIGTPQAVSGDGKMSSLPNWDRSLNPDGKFQWEVALKPGEEKELTYQYTYLE